MDKFTCSHPLVELVGEDHHTAALLFVAFLDQYHLCDMRAEVRQAEQTAVDAEWRSAKRGFVISLLLHLLFLLIHRLRRLLEDTLEEVFGIGDLKAELVLEALD